MRCWICAIGIALLVSTSRADLISDSRPASPALVGQVDEKIRSQALQFLAELKVKEARELVESIRAKNPDLPLADLILAEWLLQAGQMQSAVNLLEELASKSPPRKDIHYSFARIAMTQGRVFDAATHLEKVSALGYDPKWSQAYRSEFEFSIRETKAQIDERRSNWVDAFNAYTVLIEQKPGNLSIRFGLARSAFHAKKLDVAEQQFRLLEQAQVPPTLAELALARLFDSAQDKGKAEEWFKKGLTRSESAPAFFEYARWLIRSQRAEEAVALLKPLTEEGPTKWEALFVTSQAQQKLGRFLETESALEQILEANPQNIPASIHLAWAFADSDEEGKRLRAKEIASKVFSQARNIPIAIATLAWTQFRLGDKEGAWQTISTCPANNLPRDVVYFLARMKEDRGETESAKEFFEAIRKASGDFYHEARMTPVP